ncbi:hypothetical protein ACJX0J_038044, partial [Zea mays]
PSSPDLTYLVIVDIPSTVFVNMGVLHQPEIWNLLQLDLLAQQLTTFDEVQSGQATLKHNLQTKAGLTSAAESITESLRRSCQMMVQEVERSASTLATFDESTSVLQKSEGEYQGHRSLLMRTRGLLSTMQRLDVFD